LLVQLLPLIAALALLIEMTLDGSAFLKSFENQTQVEVYIYD